MALNEDNLTVIADEDVRALMVAMMSGDIIQEPVDVILSANAHRYALKEAYLDLLGIPEDNAFRRTVLRVEHIRGLNEALQDVDLYFKLRMIEQSRDLPRPVGVGTHARATPENGKTP